MKTLAIIPARGGSKRIPRKNIKDFLGKPIIAYSIETALKSELFDEVMVSTDDDEIAAVALRYGAKVPFVRSTKNADDFATTIEVIQEVLKEYGRLEKKFDFACCIYPTAPLIKVKHLKRGFSKLKEDKLDVVFSVVQYSYPIWRSLKRENNKTRMNWSKFANSRSQDLPQAYHDAGQWYWILSTKLGSSIFTKNMGSIVLSEMDVQDIDTMDDWCMAELKYEKIHGSK